MTCCPAVSPSARPSEAQNRGQAVTETKHKALNARVEELMEGLYTRIVRNSSRKPQKRARRSAS